MQGRSFEYFLTETEICVEDVTARTYGVTCRDKDGNESTVNDLSLNRKAVEAFVEYLNKKELDPIQLYDAIEDFLDSMP